MSLGRVDRHSGRFIDYENMFVFKNDGEVHGNRDNLVGSFFLRDMDAQLIFRLKDCVGKNSFSV